MIAKQPTIEAQDPIFWTKDRAKKSSKISPATELAACPTCGKQAIVDRHTVVRADGAYEVTQWRCGNVPNGRHIAKPKAGAHPICREERKLEPEQVVPVPEATPAPPADLASLVAQLAGAVSALAAGQQTMADKLQQLQIPPPPARTETIEDWQRQAARLAERNPLQFLTSDKPLPAALPVAPDPVQSISQTPPETRIKPRINYRGESVLDLICRYRLANGKGDSYLGTFCQLMGTISSDLTPEDWARYKEESKLAPSTISWYLVQLRAVYRWAHPDHWICHPVRQPAYRKPRKIGENQKLKPRPVAVEELPPDGPIADLTIRQLLLYNLEDIYRKTKPAGWNSPKSHTKKFTDLWGERLAESLTRAEVESYLYRRAEECAGNTVSKEAMLLKRAYNLALDRSWLSGNPLLRLRLKIKKGRRHQVLSAVDEDRLKEIYTDLFDPSYWDFERFALLTGVRIGEQIRMEPKHIQGDTLEVPDCGKTGKRLVPLCKEAQEIALRQMRRCADYQSKWLFYPHNASEDRLEVADSHSKYIWKKAAKAAGLNAFQRRDLRRTFASRLIAKGVPIFEVQKLLGHTDTATTQIYCQVGLEQLRSSVNLFDE